MIRYMQKKDVPEIALLEKQIFSSPWSEKSFLDAQASEDNLYFVAEEQGAIVGYIGIWTSFETADLCNLAVAEQYRKHLFAQGLLQEAVAALQKRKVERLLLEVRESNIPALCFYKKNNFQQIGIRKNYYSKPTEHAVLMERIF